ncbi:MAG: FAD:protein FMN transferase, partial [Candidatus Izemoplasma sp.]
MKKISIIISIIFITFIATSCSNDDVEFDNNNCLVDYDGTEFLRCDLDLSTYFDTSITLTLYIEPDIDSEPIFAEVENIIALYHILSDKYNTYEGYVNVKTINDNPTETHELSDELYNMIKYSLDNQDVVDNLFNIALNPVLKVWSSYREECDYSPLFNSGTGDCNIPTIQELNIADTYTDPSGITLDESLQTITLLQGMSIDLGGMSKGYMSLVVVEYLDSLGIRSYLFNAGTSNVEIGGIHPTRDSGKFLVAVTNPSQTNTYYATVYLSDGESIVTSGDYQR